MICALILGGGRVIIPMVLGNSVSFYTKVFFSESIISVRTWNFSVVIILFTNLFHTEKY